MDTTHNQNIIVPGDANSNLRTILDNIATESNFTNALVKSLRLYKDRTTVQFEDHGLHSSLISVVELNKSGVTAEYLHKLFNGLKFSNEELDLITDFMVANLPEYIKGTPENRANYLTKQDAIIIKALQQRDTGGKQNLQKGLEIIAEQDKNNLSYLLIKFLRIHANKTSNEVGNANNLTLKFFNKLFNLLDLSKKDFDITTNSLKENFSGDKKEDTSFHINRDDIIIIRALNQKDKTGKIDIRKGLELIDNESNANIIGLSSSFLRSYKNKSTLEFKDHGLYSSQISLVESGEEPGKMKFLYKLLDGLGLDAEEMVFAENFLKERIAEPEKIKKVYYLKKEKAIKTTIYDPIVIRALELKDESGRTDLQKALDLIEAEDKNNIIGRSIQLLKAYSDSATEFKSTVLRTAFAEIEAGEKPLTLDLLDKLLNKLKLSKEDFDITTGFFQRILPDDMKEKHSRHIIKDDITVIRALHEEDNDGNTDLQKGLKLIATESQNRAIGISVKFLKLYKNTSSTVLVVQGLYAIPAIESSKIPTSVSFFEKLLDKLKFDKEELALVVSHFSEVANMELARIPKTDITQLTKEEIELKKITIDSACNWQQFTLKNQLTGNQRNL